MKRKTLRRVFRTLFRVLARVDIEGQEKIPRTGACLLTSNHLGILDSPLLFILIERDDATGLVALKHKKNAILRWIVKQVDGIWIDRERADFGALKEARTALKNGWLLGIAPEGTRSDSHALIRAKAGVVFLADKLDVVIVPAAITGTENSLKRLLTLQRPRLTVRVGEPFRLSPIDRADREAGLQGNADEIMCRIAAMLPPGYRGVYGDHPRLRELLAELTARRAKLGTTTPSPTRFNCTAPALFGHSDLAGVGGDQPASNRTGKFSGRDHPVGDRHSDVR